MTIENREMGIRFEVDNQQDFDKWYAIRKEQIRADAIDELFNTPMEKFGDMSLKEVYEEACKMPFDEIKIFIIMLINTVQSTIQQ